MEENIISVIVPTYNSEKVISRALNSLLNQTYSLLEIIVVNDGSNDKTAEIVKGFTLKDNRIILINKNNGGVSSARNVGLKAAHGKYIMFVDADDYVEEDFCLRMFEKIRLSGSEMVSCGAVAESENGSFLYHLVTEKNFGNYDKNETILSIMKKGGISTAIWNKIFLNEIIKKNNLSFDVNIKCGEDLLFLANYVIYIDKSSYVAFEPYHYIIGTKTLSHSYDNKFNHGRMTEELAYNQIAELYGNEKSVADQLRINLLNFYETLLIEFFLANETNCSLGQVYRAKLRRILFEIVFKHRISIFKGQISLKDYLKAVATVIFPRGVALHHQKKNRSVM